MSASPMPVSLKDLLSKLEFLSMVDKFKKVNMHNMSFVDASSWIGSVQRTLTGENKKNLILFLNQIIDQALEAINEYRDTEYVAIILRHLEKSKTGIANLICTYQEFPSTISQLRVCLANMQMQLDKNKDLYIKKEEISQPSHEDEM